MPQERRLAKLAPGASLQASLCPASGRKSAGKAQDSAILTEVQNLQKYPESLWWSRGESNP